MRVVKLKVGPAVTLVYPGDLTGPIRNKLSRRNHRRIIEIQNVPDGVSDAEVIRRYGNTADVTYGSRCAFDWSELGTGKIIVK